MSLSSYKGVGLRSSSTGVCNAESSLIIKTKVSHLHKVFYGSECRSDRLDAPQCSRYEFSCRANITLE